MGGNRLREARISEIEDMNRRGLARLGPLTEHAFLAAGAALYAGEGGKGDGRVVFAGSEAAMVAFFLAWLRRFFSIDESRLRVAIYLPLSGDLAAAEAFWSSATGIPVAQFTKPYRTDRAPSARASPTPHGSARIVYSCARTHRGVMGLVRALLSSTPP
jgi:hypothetical protein